jgi:hypothetical protein
MGRKRRLFKNPKFKNKFSTHPMIINKLKKEVQQESKIELKPASILKDLETLSQPEITNDNLTKKNKKAEVKAAEVKKEATDSTEHSVKPKEEIAPSKEAKAKKSTRVRRSSRSKSGGVTPAFRTDTAN